MVGGYCEYCGSELMVNAKFCAMCGQPVPSAAVTYPTGQPDYMNQPPAGGAAAYQVAQDSIATGSAPAAVGQYYQAPQANDVAANYAAAQPNSNYVSLPNYTGAVPVVEPIPTVSGSDVPGEQYQADSYAGYTGQHVAYENEPNPTSPSKVEEKPSKRFKSSRKIIVGAVMAVIIAIAIPVVYFTQQGVSNPVRASSASSASSKAASASSSSKASNAALYENYSPDVYISLGVFPSSRTLSYGVSSNVSVASILVVLYDGYGDYIGDYTLNYSRMKFDYKVVVNGLEDASEAVAYIYAYKLEDGTSWGNRNASSDEILLYGRVLDVGIETLATTY